MLNFYNFGFFQLAGFVFIAFLLLTILFCVSYFLMQRVLELEKLTAYECGFDPFEDSLGRFDIKFYLVAILFLIFDLEIVFLFPWSMMLYIFSIFQLTIVCLFLILLFLGFFYEWRKGALDWS